MVTTRFPSNTDPYVSPAKPKLILSDHTATKKMQKTGKEALIAKSLEGSQGPSTLEKKKFPLEEYEHIAIVPSKTPRWQLASIFLAHQKPREAQHGVTTMVSTKLKFQRQD